MRSALVWLGCADPVETLHEARAADPVRALLKNVLATWAGAIGVTIRSRVSVGELIRTAQERDVTHDGGYSDSYDKDWKHPDLREALLDVADNKRGSIDNRRLGVWLKAQKGKISGSLSLANDANEHGHNRWYVEEV